MLIRLRCLRLCITAAAGMLLATSTQAQSGTSVYRCGNTYSDAPCPGGAALALALADERTPTQRQQTLAAARQDQQLATQLAAERRARAQATTGLQAARIGPTAAEQRARDDARQAKAQPKAAHRQKRSNKPRKLGAA